MRKTDLMKPELLMKSDVLSEILLLGSGIALFAPLFVILFVAITHALR